MARPRRRPLLGLLLAVLALLVAGSVLSSPPWPGVAPFFGLPPDACGQVGRAVSRGLLGFLGVPVTVALWLVLLVAASRFLVGAPRGPWLFLGWLLLTSFVASLFLAGLGGVPIWGDGPARLSDWIASGARLGPVGAALLTGGLLTLLLFWGAPRWTPPAVQDHAEFLAAGARERASVLPGAAGGVLARWGGRLASRVRSLPRPSFRGGGRAADGEEDGGGSAPTRRRRVRLAPAVADSIGAGALGGAAAVTSGPARPRRVAPTEEPDVEALDALSPLEDPEELSADPELGEDPDDDIAPILVPPEAPAAPKRRVHRRRRGQYTLPPLELLEPPGPRVGTVTREEVVEKSRILVKTLEDFGIQGSVGEVHPGPVITQYEYAPAAGVRISQIVSRSDDIALNLRASRIRIVAPIPGKAAIGIEVPNDQAEHIDFRSVLHELDLSDAHLPLCLGRDIRGRAQYGRLEKMPHLLVAGTTGSGKSVCLNACLFSLLYNRTPEDLRLLLIDPKMLELTVYDGIPHLLCPVVTDARMASRMLQWMVGEMERRYRKMATFGVRNIEGYHEKVKDKKAEVEAEPMPYIVVVVDELADLMLTLGNEIETPIARLAQMARAVGIHLILATQRPSVDVITGVIKANFPGRIAFQVATKVDSRTIIDGNGAQDLLGKGDMLYMPPGKGQPVRLHGCFVSDAECERLVEFLKEMPEPEAIFREEMLDKEGDGAEIDDELFEDALRLIVYQQQASVSFLQRRLKVGYSRAGRLMDLLESIGAVGPHEGSKPREVLADEAFLEDWLAREESIATD